MTNSIPITLESLKLHHERQVSPLSTSVAFHPSAPALMINIDYQRSDASAYNIDPVTLRITLQKNLPKVSAFTFLADRTLGVRIEDRCLTVWDFDHTNLVAKIRKDHAKSVDWILGPPATLGGRLLLIPDHTSHNTIVFDLKAGSQASPLEETVRTVAEHPSGLVVAVAFVGDWDTLIHFFGADLSEEYADIFRVGFEVTALQFTRSGKALLIVGSCEDVLYRSIYSFPDLRLLDFSVQRFSCISKDLSPFPSNRVILTPDNEFMLLGTSDGMLVARDLNTFESPWCRQIHEAPIISCDARFDLGLIATLDLRRILRIWSLGDKFPEPMRVPSMDPALAFKARTRPSVAGQMKRLHSLYPVNDWERMGR